MWAEGSNLGQFLCTAKDQGINLIILSKTKTCDLMNSDELPADDYSRRQLREQPKQICELRLAWAKEGIVYGFEMAALWWSKVESLLQNEDLQRTVEAKKAKEDLETIRSLASGAVRSAIRNGRRKVTQAEIRLLLDQRD